MPKNRKLQNIIGTEHITDAAEAAIAAQASGGATVAFKNVAVSGQDNVVADAETDTLTLAGAGGTTITTNAGTDTVTITSSDTQLSTEQVQDIVGAMFTGNTETNITATYEDSDGTIDLVASSGSSAPDIGLGGIGYIRDCDVFDSSGNTNNTAIYCTSLGLGESSSSSFGPALNPATLTFFPIIMPKTGTLSKLGIRFVGGAGGSDTAFGLYRADSTKLRPTGSAIFSQNFTPTTYTSYDFTASLSVTAGEILWVAWFGYSTTLPTLSSIQSMEAGTANLPTRKAGALTGLYTAKAKHTFRVSGNTFGTFPTIGSSYFDNAYATEQQTILPRIGMVIS